VKRLISLTRTVRAGVAARVLLLVALAFPLLITGCPFDLPDPQSPVEALIGISITSGDAPLRVVVSAEQSSSTNGAITQYVWDFAGQARSEEMTAEHTFLSPGRYPINLTVTDESGEQASARVYVRVRGGTVTAVINASRLSGTAPLTITFDGRDSIAVDDTILDYSWDFGDGGDSRSASPIHTFISAGTYTVTLTVESAGGVTGIAEATVTVEGGGAASASLQFNGTQFATLPVATDGALSAFTFEAWCKPEASGGTLVNFGVPNVGIDVSPSIGSIAVTSGSQTSDATATLQTSRWQHVAVSYSSDAGAAVYLAGQRLATLALTGEFDVAQLSLGAGFQGKIARVRFWSVARGDAEVAAGVSGDVSGFAEGLLGDWPLDEGSGQTLRNNADGGEDGTLGTSDAKETSDPAWSADAP
jgi:PKD repeat protein